MQISHMGPQHLEPRTTINIAIHSFTIVQRAVTPRLTTPTTSTWWYLIHQQNPRDRENIP